MAPIKTILATGVLALSLTTAAFAQAPAATTPPSAKQKAQLKKPMTPIAAQCSSEADAKGLHGKERQKFRSACKKNAAAKKG